MLIQTSQNTALIGYTGFVGSTIVAQKKCTDLYNSKNIQAIKGKSYDLVICAGTRATKWQINQNPEKDRKEIKSLLNNLKTIKARKFVLISTIDVYPVVDGVDEDTLPTPEQHHQAYGKHRLELEIQVKKRFEQSLIIRLPALFGVGIKKNVIFDIIHSHMLDWTHRDSSFQFYNLSNLWQDILFGLYADLEYLNLSSEPIQCGELFSYVDKKVVPERAKNPPVFYNMKSKHTPLRGIDDGYFYHKSQLLPEIIDFIFEQRKELGRTA